METECCSPMEEKNSQNRIEYSFTAMLMKLQGEIP